MQFAVHSPLSLFTVFLFQMLELKFKNIVIK